MVGKAVQHGELLKAEARAGGSGLVRWMDENTDAAEAGATQGKVARAMPTWS